MTQALTPAAILAVGSAAVGALVGAISAALTASPGWRDVRWISIAAWTASGFAACSAVSLLDASPGLVVAAAGWQFTLAALHVLAWLWHSAAPLALRPRTVRAWTAAVLPLAALLAVPGAAFREPIRTRSVEWLGSLYRDPTPTILPHLAAAVLVALLVGLAALHLRAWRRGAQGALVNAGALLFLAGVGIQDALAVAGLSDSPDLIAPGAFVPVAGVAWLTAARFVAEARELAALRVRLHRRIRGRTRVLALAREALRRTEVLASLGRIARRAGHEVNNPAASVVANLVYARQQLDGPGAPDDDTADALGDALDSARRVRALGSRLAELAGAPPSEQRTAVPLEGAVTEALALARARVPGSEDVAVEIDARGAALAHAPVLVRIVEILLENALRAAAARPPGRVAVSSVHGGARTTLLVEDRGPGMDDAVLRRLGEPFFTTQPFEATGLGVATARALAASLEGQLRFESAPGEGTRAILGLPDATAEGRAAPAAARAE